MCKVCQRRRKRGGGGWGASAPPKILCLPPLNQDKRCSNCCKLYFRGSRFQNFPGKDPWNLITCMSTSAPKFKSVPTPLRSVRESSMLEVFVQSVLKKTEGKYFPVRTEQTKSIRHLLYGFRFIFFSVYSAVFVFRCYRLPYL